MAGDIAFDTYQSLVAEAVEAVRQDFRYAEAIARQASTLIERKQNRLQKASA